MSMKASGVCVCVGGCSWDYRPCRGYPGSCLTSAGLSSAREPVFLTAKMCGQAELSSGWLRVSLQLSLCMLPLQGDPQHAPVPASPVLSLSASEALSSVQPPFNSLQRVG